MQYSANYAIDLFYNSMKRHLVSDFLMVMMVMMMVIMMVIMVMMIMMMMMMWNSGCKF